jgi:ribonuclease HI
VKLYVVTQPASIRGIYRTWPECQAAVTGVAGARFQAVASPAEAEALLSGDGVRLGPGLYAFVDGNAMGGIGVVLVDQGAGEPRVRREIATTVYEVFADAGLSALDSRAKITAVMNALRNVLAELGGLLAALHAVEAGASVTVVHDYAGIGAWLEGRWRTRDPVVAAVVAACRAVIAERRLTVAFQHQRGHQSTFAGRHDLAAFNARADRLATAAGLGASPGASEPRERGSTEVPRRTRPRER